MAKREKQCKVKGCEVDVYGAWTVLGPAERKGQVLAQCACGTTRVVWKQHLREGRSTSCGCSRFGKALKDVVTYTGAHWRVKAQRGPAKNHNCVDCGAPADEWSYDHTDPDEIEEQRDGYPVAYSLKPEHYSPRCIADHRALDRKELSLNG